MRRREFIVGLGSAAAWPVMAHAQQPALPVIGFLSAGFADDDLKNFTVPFLQGLKETGYVEGQNVAIEYRWAEMQADRLPALAADLVRRRVAVIACATTPAALAAKAATTTIPIVFATGGDPVALGLVVSLNRPGANATGSANLTAELAPKKLQLLRELIPNAALFGVLADPAFPATPSAIADLRAAAPTLGLQLVVVNASIDRDLEPAFLADDLLRCSIFPSRANKRQKTGALRRRPGSHAPRTAIRCFVMQLLRNDHAAARIHCRPRHGGGVAAWCAGAAARADAADWRTHVERRKRFRA